MTALATVSVTRLTRTIRHASGQARWNFSRVWNLPCCPGATTSTPALPRSDILISLGLSDEWLKQTSNGKADLLCSSLLLVDLQIHLTFRNYYNGMISAQDNYYVVLVWVVRLRVGR